MAGDDTKTSVVLLHAGLEVARWPLPSADEADLGLVDVLARVALAARRAGCVCIVEGAPRALSELVDLVGVADVVRLVAPTAR